MRIGVRCQTEVGLRAARVLVADPGVEEVALLPGSTHVAVDLGRAAGNRWDIIVTDSDADATWSGKRVVTSRVAPRGWGGDLVFGADLVTGIAASLAALEASKQGAARLVVAFTTLGTPLRRGRRLRFPDPVGARLGKPASSPGFPKEITALEAPGPDPWAGVLIEISRADQDVPFRVVGAADERMFLEGLALAAAALVAGVGAYPRGVSPASAAPRPYVEAALRCGLTVAWYSSSS